MKIERTILVIIMAVVVGLGIWVLRENATSLNIIVPVFIMAVGSFLGIDVWKMIKQTEALPSGDFEDMDKWKYYLVVGFFLAFVAEVFFIEKYYILSLSTTMGFFIAGIIAVLGTMVTGFQVNSSVTGEKAEE